MVEEREGTQSFSGQKNLTFTTPFGQLLGTLPTSVNGTVKDGKISMKIGVTVAALEQVVDVDFDGNKMTGTKVVKRRFCLLLLIHQLKLTQLFLLSRD